MFFGNFREGCTPQSHKWAEKYIFFLRVRFFLLHRKKNSGKFFHLEKIVTVFFAVMDTQCRIPMSTGGGSGKSGKRQIGEQTC